MLGMVSRRGVARIAGRSPGVRMVSGSRTGLRRPEDLALLLGDWQPPRRPAAATESEALALPPFGRAVALLAGAVASTEWHAARWDPELGVKVRLPDQPSVLRDPAPLSTPWHYRWAAAEDLIEHGNHFALLGDVDHRTNRAGYLLPIPADDVWILTDPTRPDWYAWAVAGYTFAADEVLHVSAGNRSGEILGRGVLAQYGSWLGGVVAAEQHAADYFAGGALPPAVLQAPAVIQQEQADDLKAKWRTMVSTREPVILPTGYVLTPVVSDAEKSQLVQSRTWNASQVALVVGVPEWKLGLPGPTMTYQNVETADIDFVRDSVDRWAQPLSAAITKWLMPLGTSVEWEYAGRMRADQRTSAEVIATLVNAQVLTVDEGRARIGLPPMGAAPTLTPDPVI